MASGATYLTGRNLVRRARRGLYAGRMVLSGNKISEDGGNRTRRKWKPNVQHKTLYSEILDRHISFRLTAHALRCIDKAGGLDAYILNTPDKKLGSDVGAALREELRAAQLVPPPLPGALSASANEETGGRSTVALCQQSMDVHHHYADNATDHAPGSHPVADCDGTEIWRTYGTWKGHVGPGSVFVLWGSWWTVWVLWAYLSQGPRRFKAAPWYGPVVRGWRLPLEPALKLVGPALIAWIELYGDHDEFRTLTCPDGRFAMTHMNNWQHASVYPGFFLAAALDWAAMFVPLPAGLQQVALAGAFFNEGFLMANHKKHEALDQSVHTLLVTAIFGTVAAIALELLRPRSVLPPLGRCLCTLVQGAWLIQIARIMWGGDPRWSLDYPGSAMMPPVYFVWILVTIAACICACYVGMAVALQRFGGTQYSLLPRTQQDAAAAAELLAGKASRCSAASHWASQEAAELYVKADAGGRGDSFVSMRSQGSLHMRTDSANESRPGSPRLEGVRGVSPFSIDAQRTADDW